MKLYEEKRIETVILKRNMSPSQVRLSIHTAFKHHKLTSWEYLEVAGGQLVTATKNQVERS